MTSGHVSLLSYGDHFTHINALIVEPNGTFDKLVNTISSMLDDGVNLEELMFDRPSVSLSKDDLMFFRDLVTMTLCNTVEGMTRPGYGE